MFYMIIDSVNIIFILFTLVYPISDYAKFISFVSFSLMIVSMMYRGMIVILNNHGDLNILKKYRFLENKINSLEHQNFELVKDNTDLKNDEKEIYINDNDFRRSTQIFD